MPGMMEEMDESIRKHLPEKVGKLLQERLAKLETLEKDHEKLRKVFKDREQQLVKQDVLEANLKDLANRESRWAAEGAALDERAKNVSLAEVGCEVRQATYEDMKEICLALVGVTHVSVRRLVPAEPKAEEPEED